MAAPHLDRRTFAGLAIAAALGGGRALAQDTASRIPSVGDVYEPPTNMAMVADLYSRMTAPLRIDGSGPFPFVVDTGANQSVISADLAARLGLTQGASLPVNGVAGVELAPTALATVTVGERKPRPVTLFVLPQAAIGGVGMLGLDGLEGEVFTLDFRRKILHIEPPGGRRRMSPRTVVMKARRRDGQLTLVDADIAGIPVTAFIDSGAQNTIGNLALRRMAVARRATDVWLTAPIVSVTGQTMQAEMAILPRLRLAGMALPQWDVAFADLHTFRLWNLDERPAILIGVDVLSRFEEVTLDFARSEVRFLPPDDRFLRTTSS